MTKIKTKTRRRPPAFTYRMVKGEPLSYEEADNNLRRMEHLHRETERLYSKVLLLHDKIKRMRMR